MSTSYVTEDGQVLTTKQVEVAGKPIEVNTEHLNFDGSFKDQKLKESLERFEASYQRAVAALNAENFQLYQPKGPRFGGVWNFLIGLFAHKH